MSRVDQYCCKDVYGAHESHNLEVPRDDAELLRKLRLRCVASVELAVHVGVALILCAALQLLLSARSREPTRISADIRLSCNADFSAKVQTVGKLCVCADASSAVGAHCCSPAGEGTIRRDKINT